MDALPILEDTGVEYASECPGIMHACGHDGHTSILLGAARVLSQSERRNSVLFVFQPAEEGGAGGEAMCVDGVLDGKVIGPPADRIFGLHGYPQGELSNVYTRNGALLAAASQFEIEVRGKGAHAAYPHLGIDPIVVASHIVTALQTVASRSVDPLDSIVVTVGKLDGGVAHNVIPEAAVLSGTLRSLNDATNQIGIDKIGSISRGVAEGFGAMASVKWVGAYPVTYNDPATTDRVRQAVVQVLGPERLHEEPNPSMGGEDFSFYGRRVPASFFFLGLRPTGVERMPLLHSPQFNFNDDALSSGIEMMVALANG
jgi:amidohydrolase